jgi:hypothetical protein
MTTQQIVLLAIFLAVLTAAGIYISRLKTKQATVNKLGRAPRSEEEGIAVATTSGTRAETDYKEQIDGTGRNPKAPR